jgi:hypothetical protein
LLSTFRDNLSVQSSRVKQVPLGCTKTSVKIYQPDVHNTPEERISPLNRGGSLKSRAGKVKVGPTGRTETAANGSQPSALYKVEDQPNFSVPRNV